MLTLKKLKVQDVCNFDPDPSLLVGPDEDFAEIIQRFARLHELRGIFVVDDEQRLLGVITRADLLDWTRVKIGSPEEILFTSTSKVKETVRLVSLMQASTVGQFMRPNSHLSAVKCDDTLAYALQVMIEMDLIVLPVVDESGRVVEDLKLSELLALTINEDGNKD
jgi:CBS-domain-containing membrane protein